MEYGSESNGMMITRKYLGLLSAAMAIMLLIGCQPGNTTNIDTDIEVKSTTSDSINVQDQKPIKLNFQAVDTESQVKAVGNSDIFEIISRENIIGIIVFISRNKSDDENLHGGMEIDSIIYDLGKVSMMVEKGEASHIASFKSIKLYGKDFIKFSGVMGANYAQTNYYTVEEGVPRHYLSVDGHAVEMDLDGDGEVEIITSTGTLAQTYIYKYKEGSFAVADINKALGLEAVYLSDKYDSYLEGYEKDNGSPIYYRLTKDGLVNAVTQ